MNNGNGMLVMSTKIYKNNGGTWQQRQIGGDIDGEAAYDESGRSVSINGVSDGNCS